MEKEKRYMIYAHVFAVGLTATVITFLPYLADFYVLEPDHSILTFFVNHSIDRFYFFETALAALAIAGLWCLGGRLWAALTVPSLLFLVLAYADSIKYAALNELLRFNDLMVTEAAGIALQHLNLKFSAAQIEVMACVIFLCAAGYIAERFCRKYPLLVNSESGLRKRLQRLRLLSGCSCLVGMIAYGGYFIQKNAYSVEVVDAMNVINTDNDRYIVYNFLKNDRLTEINLDHAEDSYRFFLDGSKPDGAADETGKRPNIIVIMNESWWNTDQMIGSDITFSSDPMEVYKRLEESCSSGQLTANIFGGGTIGSETEFLTGLNTKYFVSYTGIGTELEKRKVPSIVDYFHALDYDTVAIHPYVGSFYGRNTIYPSMGFDKIVFEEDMDYTDIYSCYISDGSLARQIIKEFEESKAERRFIFSVSIANHRKGLDSRHASLEAYPYPISVKLNGSLDEEAYMELVNYINGIYLASEAFEQLTAYFAQAEEPVVLLMYGDHMPGFTREALKLMGLDGRDSETQRRQYSVPVLMWSNFRADRMEFDGENINYLPQILLEYAGLPESDMTRILRRQREVLKTNTRMWVADEQGRTLNTYNDSQSEVVRHFKVVDYDILFGNGPRRESVWLPRF